jgi:hypothetical protein
MPLNSHCQNCGIAKTPDRYAEFLCLDCQDAHDAVERQIVDEQITDMTQKSQLRQEALLKRRNTSMSARPDPREPFSRMDTADFQRRLSAEPGSTEDPRRG